MPVLREALEAREHRELAPWAQKAGESAGRAEAEAPHPLRTGYQRDRARIIHSRAFRRLECKTQVFLDGVGDHYRTRLTHTIEVASVSRALATALGLNVDLAEAVSLAHDLGHPPFGHAGEEVLDELMREHGGFEHNQQSLRVVELIENREPGVRGLNLTYEVLEGLRKHAAEHRRPARVGGGVEVFASPSLEAQAADVADGIAYGSHDLEDGLESGLIEPADLERLALWNHCAEAVRRWHNGPEDKCFRSCVIRALIDHQVEDVVYASDARLQESGCRSADEARRVQGFLVGPSAEAAEAGEELRAFLFRKLYRHPSVEGANSRAKGMIRDMFAHYEAHPEDLGARTAARIPGEGLRRTVCDYVSGMTDRFLTSARRGRRG
ncbi:MAG TPA: dNTP triphosphohydrolase [Verrucomicrobiales bacterium]|nr:dNTP triphosphohydrolase [Verrucomicrobiales bacterium]